MLVMNHKQNDINNFKHYHDNHDNLENMILKICADEHSINDTWIKSFVIELYLENCLWYIEAQNHKRSERKFLQMVR